MPKFSNMEFHSPLLASLAFLTLAFVFFLFCVRLVELDELD